MTEVTRSQDPPWSLTPHVRACASDSQIILLDLRSNRYLGMAREQTAALGKYIAGWPDAEGDAPPEIVSSAVEVLVQRLASQGLVSRARFERDPQVPLPAATSSLDFEDELPGSSVDSRRLFHFARSAAISAAWLRFRSLHSISVAVSKRRPRLGAPADVGTTERMRAAAAAYDRLRPFGFTARDRCLHDSLALVGFLASEEIFPRWVIGVKTHPFAAHSWVQSGGTVLNDQHDHVRSFSPILVV